ncbi:mitochondrial protein [Phytophthora palmivora]|uniref:Mitochondrial protein n=1 Tax=Phytophthora palmivora TaxID=4796 RepID=A0A2P4XD19_9STRA|nr:mitochondrial protein [Phytophthora palmivora]
MVARIAAKKGSVWLSDPSTYPLLTALGVATAMCLSMGVRHLTTSPDVKWDREVRKHPEMALKDRTEWRSHRKVIAGMHSNAVNAYHDKE